MDGLYFKNFGLIGKQPDKKINDARYIINNSVKGLAGKFFNWTYVDGLFDPGKFPLNSTNDSSNVTGTTGLPSAAHRYGVNLFTSIAYGDGLGDNYTFVAIGYFIPPTTGTYTFYTSSDDDSAVWLGEVAAAKYGRTIANAIVDNGMSVAGGQANTERSGTIDLMAGIAYPIRIIHQEGAGGDNLTFSWAGPGISKTTDLSQHFYTPIKNGVLIGDYFDLDYYMEADVQSGVFDVMRGYTDRVPPAAFPPQNPEIYYDFLDPRCYPGSGNTIFDLSGNGRNATIVGSPTFTYPYFTNFSDSNYIQVSNSGIAAPAQGAFSYSAMVMFDAVDANDTIFENGYWTDGFLLRYENGTTIGVYAEGATISQQTWRANVGGWYYINLVRAAQVGYIYVNGEIVVPPFAFTTNISIADTLMFLMRSRHTTGQFTTGKLAQFTVHSIALTPAAIKRNYKNLIKRYNFR
jgi:hypothetical protein